MSFSSALHPSFSEPLCYINTHLNSFNIIIIIITSQNSSSSSLHSFFRHINNRSPCHGLLLPLMYLRIATLTTFHLPPTIPLTTDFPVLELGRAAVPVVPPVVEDSLAPGSLINRTPASPRKNQITARLSTSTRTSRFRSRRVGITCLRR